MPHATNCQEKNEPAKESEEKLGRAGAHLSLRGPRIQRRTRGDEERLARVGDMSANGEGRPARLLWRQRMAWATSAGMDGDRRARTADGDERQLSGRGRAKEAVLERGDVLRRPVAGLTGGGGDLCGKRQGGEAASGRRRRQAGRRGRQAGAGLARARKPVGRRGSPTAQTAGSGGGEPARRRTAAAGGGGRAAQE